MRRGAGRLLWLAGACGLGLGAGVAGSGCAKGGAAKAPDAQSLRAQLHPRELTIRRSDGSPANWEDLVQAGAQADAVLIGEHHGQDVGQAFMGAYFADLLARAKGAAAALEFVERDEQSHLDDFLSGVTTEDQFRKATGRTEGNYPAGHRAIVQACRVMKRPVSAANSPRRYNQLARTKGFEALRALSEEQRRLFRIPEVGAEGPNFERFVKLMRTMRAERAARAAKGVDGEGARSSVEAVDGEGEARLRRDAADLYRSQSLWDWTMGESVARMIGDGPGKGRPVVLIVGEFHVAHEGGTVAAVRALRPETRVVTISCMPGWGPTASEEERGRADFLVFIGPLEESVATGAE